MTTASGFTNEGTYAPPNLFAGDYPRIERIGIIAAGAALTVGAVLGRITASGKYVLSDSAAVDGSQTPVAILGEDAAAAAADVDAMIYLAGEFNEVALTFGGAHTADTTRDGLRDLNIYLKKNTGA